MKTMDNNYEKSFKRLEKIVALLDNGGLSLDETLELFSEGTALVKKCSDYLSKAEQKVTKLLENGEENE